MAKNNLDWLEFEGVFNFHSPYPIDDCENMLLGYTPSLVYKTPWGLGKGIVMNDRVEVAVHRNRDSTCSFVMEYVNPAKLNPIDYMIYHLGFVKRLQAVGIVYPDGDGTRVMGSVKLKTNDDKFWQMILLITVLVAPIAGVYPVIKWEMIPLTAMVIIIGGAILNEIVTGQLVRIMRAYPKYILGGKSGRKRKLADDAEFE
jgi:hypothetical protein